MTRRKKDPLRPLQAEEHDTLTHLSRSQAAPAVLVTRAKMLLAVASGSDYQRAARSAGRRSGDAVAHLVSRFNREGLAALPPRHGGGSPARYDAQAKARILREVRRTPTHDRDGTATWSLTTLREALRRAADGLPGVSTYTIWITLHEAGFSFQQSRSWCPTGTAQRKRKAGVVVVTDPDAGPKKS